MSGLDTTFAPDLPVYPSTPNSENKSSEPTFHPPAIALYNYTGKTPHELSFVRGDIIEVIEKAEENGWWEGILGDQRGVFPSNFVTQARRVQAVYDYMSTDETQLSFVKDELLEVFAEMESGWWEGRVVGFGKRRGLFPSNFVTEISVEQSSKLLRRRIWLRTLAEFKSEQEGYMSFQKDERILVIWKHESGWWSGRIDEWRVGRFPSNYISEVETEDLLPVGTVQEETPSLVLGTQSFDFSDQSVVAKGKAKSIYKVIVVGDSGVGKTGLCQRYDRQSFVPMTVPTVGADFVSKLYKLNSGEIVKVQLWDTAGQERYQTITKLYYHGSVGAILVYDITNHSTLEHLSKWLKELKIHSYNDNLLLMLVGNKADLNATREVTWEEGNEFAQQHNFFCFFETSALTGDNTSSAFTTFLQEIHRICGVEKLEENKVPETFKVTKPDEENEQTVAKDPCCILL
eukprot:TRINITY_DN1818_c0_g1_i1.p1 TRINITY_DN1818_c0_g1~~TRINITY_DN1818_c0_g1_i1.p1  ORF type:complete len:459 (+),score=97.96 TRINITY_DN1818_c0_g1_i1:125-1501(+)